MGQVGLDSTRTHADLEHPLSDAVDMRRVGVSSQIDLSAYSHLPRLLTPKQVERESGLSKGTINKAIQSGRLKSIKPTVRARRIPVEYFAEWVAAMKAGK